MRPTLVSGILRLEWTGSCYSYQDHKSRIVNITKEGSGWVSLWINPSTDSKGPFVLPSVGKFATLKDAFLSSIAGFCH
jgi:hypothetical protein